MAETKIFHQLCGKAAMKSHKIIIYKYRASEAFEEKQQHFVTVSSSFFFFFFFHKKVGISSSLK